MLSAARLTMFSTLPQGFLFSARRFLERCSLPIPVCSLVRQQYRLGFCTACSCRFILERRDWGPPRAAVYFWVIPLCPRNPPAFCPPGSEQPLSFLSSLTNNDR